jgi:hypothetical protein
MIFSLVNHFLWWPDVQILSGGKQTNGGIVSDDLG